MYIFNGVKNTKYEDVLSELVRCHCGVYNINHFTLFKHQQSLRTRETVSETMCKSVLYGPYHVQCVVSLSNLHNLCNTTKKQNKTAEYKLS